MAKYEVTRRIETTIVVEADDALKAIGLEDQLRLAKEELGEQYRGPEFKTTDEVVGVQKIDATPLDRNVGLRPCPKCGKYGPELRSEGFKATTGPRGWTTESILNYYACTGCGGRPQLPATSVPAARDDWNLWAVIEMKGGR